MAPTVTNRCLAKYRGGGCVQIYDPDMHTVLRIVPCRKWCPLLKETIE
jgi:hypothetical protein